MKITGLSYIHFSCFYFSNNVYIFFSRRSFPGFVIVLLIQVFHNNLKNPHADIFIRMGTIKERSRRNQISAAHTYISYISYHIQFARMHKAKLWQNRSKTVAKTRYMELVPLLNRKCQKSTALLKYVISCIFLSFIVNSRLLFGAGCAIIITEDDSIVQLMTYLKGVHHDFC